MAETQRMLSMGHAGMIDPLRYAAARTEATLATALLDIGSDEALLLVSFSGDGAWTVNAPLVFPSNILVIIPPGVTITGAGNMTFGRAPLCLQNASWYQGSGLITILAAHAPAVSLGDPLYGAVGDGTTDDSAAVQAACNAAIARGVALDVPAPAVGYRINTPINLTNLNGSLTIRGQGIVAPTFGLAFVSPTSSSVFLGNTGTGHPIFDCLGSNNIVLRDCNLSALGMPTPSTVGLLFGTSTTSPAAQTPGGANIGLENVAIYLNNANNSCPIYFVGGAGLSHFTNVWTLGVYGLVITRTNLLGLSSTHVTIDQTPGVDGVYANGCSLLGYGGASVLEIEDCHNMRFAQLYVATIAGGPSYTGTPYAITLHDTIDIKIEVECDYFPSLLRTTGAVEGIEVRGTVFPSTTPIPTLVPIVAFFDGTSVDNSMFRVTGALGAVDNYWYTSDGITPSLLWVRSCAFFFRAAISSHIFFGEATGAAAVPFFNLVFDGDSDTVITHWAMNGSVATAGQLRYRVNGVLFGTG